jgi:hypothetical protein
MHKIVEQARMSKTIYYKGSSWANSKGIELAFGNYTKEQLRQKLPEFDSNYPFLIKDSNNDPPREFLDVTVTSTSKFQIYIKEPDNQSNSNFLLLIIFIY